MSAIIDPAGTGSARIDERGRRTDELVIEISGLPADPFLARARAMSHSQVPQLGQAHPVYPEIQVTEIQVAPTSEPATKRVTVRYGTPTDQIGRPPSNAAVGPVEWSTGVRTVTEPTSRDWRGEWMLVRYAGVPVLESINANTGELIGISSAFYRAINLARIDRVKPLLVLVARRWQLESPEAEALLYTSKVNSTVWRGYAPQTVFCDGVYSEPDFEGGFRVEYQFTVNPAEYGWRHESAIRINGSAPLDAEIGNGVEFFEIYEPVNFAGLGLE